MELKDIKDILSETDFPVRYLEFKSTVQPPFIVFIEEKPETVKADNITYTSQTNIRIELYTIQKDKEAERCLENILTENEIEWEADDIGKIGSENLYEKVYYITI